MTLKVLNLYAGIGGNRKLWTGVEVTAVEINPEIAKIYQNFFPNDKVIVADAHQYLLDHYKEFDFIWSSPPCPTHSKVRFINQIQNPPIYPDMNLYQEIIFLKNYFRGKWVVENVTPYYEPLIKPQYSGRHCFWANFIITNKKTNPDVGTTARYKEIAKRKDMPSDFEISNKVKILRNCVKPSLGKYVFDCAFRVKQKKLLED